MPPNWRCCCRWCVAATWPRPRNSPASTARRCSAPCSAARSRSASACSSARATAIAPPSSASAWPNTPSASRPSSRRRVRWRRCARLRSAGWCASAPPTPCSMACCCRRCTRCARAHPQLRLEIHARNELANLTQREADVALRATAKPPAHLVGRHLGPIRSAVFIARAAAPKRSRDIDLANASWIAVDEALPEHPSVRWRRKHLPRVEPVLRLNSVQAVFDAVRRGLGVGIAPLFLARGVDDVTAITPPLDECETQLWLLDAPGVAPPAAHPGRGRSHCTDGRAELTPAQRSLSGRRVRPAVWRLEAARSRPARDAPVGCRKRWRPIADRRRRPRPRGRWR